MSGLIHTLKFQIVSTYKLLIETAAIIAGIILVSALAIDGKPVLLPLFAFSLLTSFYLGYKNINENGRTYKNLQHDCRHFYIVNIVFGFVLSLILSLILFIFGIIKLDISGTHLIVWFFRMLVLYAGGSLIGSLDKKNQYIFEGILILILIFPFIFVIIDMINGNSCICNVYYNIKYSSFIIDILGSIGFSIFGFIKYRTQIL